MNASSKPTALLIAILAIFSIAVARVASPQPALAQAVEDIKIENESPSEDAQQTGYEIEDIAQENKPAAATQPEDITILSKKRQPTLQTTGTEPPPLQRPAVKTAIKEQPAAAAEEPPEDLHREAEPPPGADKLKRSAKKPSEMKIEPSEIASNKNVPVPATAAAETPATGAVKTASLATGPSAATDTSTITSASSTIASLPAAATAPVSVSQLPPGAVIVDTTAGQPTRKPRDVVPYGTVELVKRTYSSSGNNAAFLSQNGLLFFNDKFEQNVMLGITGKLDNGMKIDGEFRDRQYLDKVFHISVSGKTSFADFGDTQAQFVSGGMTGFTKSIRGVSAGYTAGNTSVRALMSNVKSKTQGEAFNGRNIRGPYPLASTDIMENTESIRVNGRVLPRSEYSMDYFLGQITFVRVMDPADRIEINYESRLWAASKTGDLRGVSLTTTLLRNRAGMGFAYMTESTEDSNASKIYSAVFTASKQTVSDNAGALSLGYTKLEKNREIVTAVYGTSSVYLTRSSDYTVDYPSGVVYFATASLKFLTFATDTSFIVSFNYYKQRDLQWAQNEELSGDGQLEYRLQYESVYGGTEVVNLYENGALIRSLQPGKDYQIVEGNNSIVFLDSNVMPSQSYGRTVKISYEIVPLNVRAATYASGRRNVMSLFGNAKLGKTNIGGEFARTQAQVRLKEVPVVEEVVASVTDPAQKTYLLDNSALLDSVEIYFDDPSAPSSRKNSGSDYIAELDPATGKTKLTFKNTIPAGTTILANYRYRVEPGGGDNPAVNGDAVRLLADTSAGAFALKGEFMKKSPFFAPLTAYNDLESDRLLASASVWQDKRVSFNFDLARHTTFRNLNDYSKIQFNQYTGKVSYKARKNVTAAYTFQRASRADDLAAKLTDNSSLSNRLDIGYTMKNVFTSGLTYEKKGYRDATGVAADRDTTRYGASINYAPTEKIRLDLALDSSGMLSTPPLGSAADEFTISNLSTRIGAVYLPDKNMSLNIKLDKQNITDSRSGVKNNRLDSINADLFGRTDTRIRDYLLSFYRQDRPDLIYGDSRTDIATFRTSIEAASQVVLIPSYVITKSAIGVVTTSGDNTLGLRAEYRAAAALGWRAAAAYTSSSRSGSTVSGVTPGSVTYTDSKQTQTSLTLDYIPSAKFSVTSVFQTTGVKSQSAAPQSRNSYSTTLNYFMNEITTLRLLFNLEKPPAPTGSLTTLELNATRKIDKNLDFGLDYKTQKQQGAAAAGYTGKLITMKLLASF